MIVQSICFHHQTQTWGKQTKKWNNFRSRDPRLRLGAFFLLTGTPVKNNVTGVVEYEMQGPLQYLVWYHAVGLIWITEFIFAFQQMTIAGAVVTYYFTRWVGGRFLQGATAANHLAPSDTVLSPTNQLPVLFQCVPESLVLTFCSLSLVMSLWNILHALQLWRRHSWSCPSCSLTKRSSTFKYLQLPHLPLQDNRIE